MATLKTTGIPRFFWLSFFGESKKVTAIRMVTPLANLLRSNSSASIRLAA